MIRFFISLIFIVLFWYILPIYMILLFLSIIKIPIISDISSYIIDLISSIFDLFDDTKNNLNQSSLNTTVDDSLYDKSEIKLSHKQRNNINIPSQWVLDNYTVGIYKITNLSNQKVYIGESVNMQKRWKKHFYDLKKGIHHNYKMQKDFNLQNEKDFFPELIKRFEYTDYTDTKLRLLVAEEHYIQVELALGKEVYNYDNSHYSRIEKVNLKKLYINNEIYIEEKYIEDGSLSNCNKEKSSNLKTQRLTKEEISKFTTPNATEYLNISTESVQSKQKEAEIDYIESPINDDHIKNFNNKILINFDKIKTKILLKYTLEDIYFSITQEEEREFFSFDYFKYVCKEIYKKEKIS